MEHTLSLTLLSDFVQLMGDAHPEIATSLCRDANALTYQYAGFKAGRGGYNFDRPIFQIDFEQLPSLMLPMVALGINSVRQCSCCGELFLLTASGQKGPELCIGCKRENAASNLRRWRAEKKRVLQPKPCVVCGTEFTPKRSDAKVCSGKCRTKLSRSKKAD